jgi:VWFA-related protein
VFTISPELSAPTPVQNLIGKNSQSRFELRQIADDTGGRSFTPARMEDLAGVYEDIAGELSQQYWLAYVPPPGAREGYRRVSVRVETRPGLRVRTRTGYYARGS